VCDSGVIDIRKPSLEADTIMAPGSTRASSGAFLLQVDTHMTLLHGPLTEDLGVPCDCL